MKRRVLSGCALIAALLTVGAVGPRPAAAVEIDPAYAGAYSLVDLGGVPGLPPPAGGLNFVAGDFTKLLIGGEANTADADIYSVDLLRDGDGHITGFAGVAVAVATAAGGAGGGIDGGLDYAPNGVLFYTSWPDNYLGQIKPGSAGPDKLIDLTPLGVAPSVGAFVFVPTGQPGAGRFKLLSYDADIWYDAALTPDGFGTYDVALAGPSVVLSGGLEGAVYVPTGSPLFPSATVLVAEFDDGRIAAYDVDGNGDPVAATRRDFVTGLTGAEGALIDPVTGDFLFSTFGGGDRVIVVRGFVPEPATLLLLAVGAGVLVCRRAPR